MTGRHAVWHGNDSPYLAPVVDSTAKRFNNDELPGDKAYLSNGNLAKIAGHGATPYNPFKGRCVKTVILSPSAALRINSVKDLPRAGYLVETLRQAQGDTQGPIIKAILFQVEHCGNRGTATGIDVPLLYA